MVKKSKEETAVEIGAQSVEPRFAKADILTSKQFTPVEKDFLQAVLLDSKQYSLSEARAALEKKFKEVVK